MAQLNFLLVGMIFILFTEVHNLKILGEVNLIFPITLILNRFKGFFSTKDYCYNL